MVEVIMHDMMEEAEEQQWISQYVNHAQTYFDEAWNFTRFKHNFRLRRFTMSLKAIALNVEKCRAEPVMRFLRLNNLNAIQPIWPAENTDHLAQYPELRISRGV